MDEQLVYYPSHIIGLIQEDVKRRTGKTPAIYQLKIEKLDPEASIEVDWNQK